MLEEENKLVKQAQEGRAESFGLLYDHYASQIYRFIFLKVNNKAVAEDLLHEVFLSAWQNINNYSPQGFPFSSWLYQIARNRTIDHYRTSKEFVDVDSAQSKLVTAFTDSQIDQRLILDKIKTALTKLSEEQGNIIIMRFINDLSPAEIAIIINKSEGAVRLIQHRAIVNLKKILGQEKYEL